MIPSNLFTDDDPRASHITVPRECHLGWKINYELDLALNLAFIGRVYKEIHAFIADVSRVPEDLKTCKEDDERHVEAKSST